MNQINLLKETAEQLVKELINQMEELYQSINNPMQWAEMGLVIAMQKMEVLKSTFCSLKNLNKQEEIAFFKNSKPLLSSQLIYFNEIYAMELKKPIGNNKTIRKYYQSELAKITAFFETNLEFYTYYRSGTTTNDERYFLRQQPNKQLVESYYFQMDNQFATSHDFKVAQIIAQEEIKKYIDRQLSNLKSQTAEPHEKSRKQFTQQWTAPKVALVELVYALHNMGVFNNGQSTLKTTMDFIEAVFQTDLGQYHRIYLEIRSRKTDRTKFINSLKENLILRMDTADEK